MVMGSPLYGTVFATIAVAPEELHLPGGVNAVWPSVHSSGSWSTARSRLLLFLATLATFDHCLGRVSEVAGRSMPVPGKKPTPRSSISRP